MFSSAQNMALEFVIVSLLIHFFFFCFYFLLSFFFGIWLRSFGAHESSRGDPGRSPRLRGLPRGGSSHSSPGQSNHRRLATAHGGLGGRWAAGGGGSGDCDCASVFSDNKSLSGQWLLIWTRMENQSIQSSFVCLVISFWTMLFFLFSPAFTGFVYSFFFYVCIYFKYLAMCCPIVVRKTLWFL